jgi:hypothetical protein
VSYFHGRYSPLVPALNQSSEIRLGTSAFVADGWETSFDPKGMKPAHYLT